MTRRSRKRRHQDVADLNITAFMNLMVVLVPFLLITAVFSRVSILELNLPAADTQSAQPPEAPAFQLEVTVRESTIEVGDRTQGLLRRFDMHEGVHDLEGLAEFLVEVKQQFPETLDAMLLLEPDVSYEMIVAVMDRIRAAERRDESTGGSVWVELFPDIAIGDAALAARR